jgi:hypothetical protein
VSTLLAPRVWQNITAAAANCPTPARVAVAYFGEMGDRLLPLPKGSSLVVDASIPTLAAGATCPAALDRLRRNGTAIYTAQYLHAKVYGFDNVAFIGSANVSRRSERVLIEAVLCIQDKATIASARKFVEALCVTPLSAADLKDLSHYYRPPRFRAPTFVPRQVRYATLLMELTLEQGPGRETQVQPPKAVWEHFFGLRVGRQRLPRLSLVYETDPALQLSGRVIAHHHIYTIELAGAEMPRPAILQMRRTGRNDYSYRILRPPSSDFNTANTLLQSVPNPLWESGRLWIVL